MAANGLSGGARLQAHLDRILERVKSAKEVRVGFLEGATYPDGTSVPMVAAVQEFGGSMEIPTHEQNLNFKLSKSGEVGSRFVKADKAGFTQTVMIPAHTVTIPPRPFFRTMLNTKSGQWGKQVGAVLKSSDYDAQATLGRMGELIKGQLQGSIRELTSPPDAPSTVKRKGFSKPLIDTGVMLNSVDYEVTG